MDILRIVSLRGPGIWTYPPVLEAWVDIGELEDFPSNKIPGLYERLTAWLPTLVEHRCSPGVRGGFLQRLREGTWPGHIMEHVTLELQNLAGLPGGFGKARETSERGVYKVVVHAWEENVTRAALHAGRDLVMAAIEDRPYDVPGAIEMLRGLVQRHYLGPSTACIVDAADARGIPSIRLNTGNLVQLGYGARQRRIWTAETDHTSAIAESISRDKDLTKRLLGAAGVPVPEGQVVESPGQAWEAAQDIGLPVVVKPTDGNHGRGVFTRLEARADIETAYGIAAGEGSGVIVERFVPGNEHRLLVVGGKLVAAARGQAAVVVGDGRSTVAGLIERQLNADPRRGSTEEHPLNPVRLDSAARIELERQGLHADAVPADGREVMIQRNGNVAFDCTDDVHPEVAAAAALAARVVGLDIAGIDLVAEDISRPLAEQRGAVVEVNAGPGLLMHLKPAEGKPRPVGEAIVDHLFPPGEPCRIPVVGVTGTNGKTIVAKLVARLLDLAGLHTGLACSDGLYLDRRCIGRGDRARWDQARRLLLNRAVQAAVIENGSDAILTEGLAYDRCRVGIVTNLGPAACLGRHDVHEPGQVFTIFRTQVDVVVPDGAAVLNAADPLVADMARLCDGEVLFFGLDAGHEVIAAHVAADRRAVVLKNGAVTLLHGQRETVLSDVAGVPITCGGQAAFQVENVLAAVAAAWAMDLAPELIRAGIETFDTDLSDLPGRFHAFERDGMRVVLDGAANVGALQALLPALARFPAGRRTAVCAAPAGGRDEDIARQGELLGQAFAHVTLHDAGQPHAGPSRARLGGAIRAAGAGVDEQPDPAAAINAALAGMRAGELLFVQHAQGGAALDCIRQWLDRPAVPDAA